MMFPLENCDFILIGKHLQMQIADCKVEKQASKYQPFICFSLLKCNFSQKQTKQKNIYL